LERGNRSDRVGVLIGSLCAAMARLNRMEHEGFSSGMIKLITLSPGRATKLYADSELVSNRGDELFKIVGVIRDVRRDANAVQSGSVKSAHNNTVLFKKRFR